MASRRCICAPFLVILVLAQSTRSQELTTCPFGTVEVGERTADDDACTSRTTTSGAAVRAVDLHATGCGALNIFECYACCADIVVVPSTPQMRVTFVIVIIVGLIVVAVIVLCRTGILSLDGMCGGEAAPETKLPGAPPASDPPDRPPPKSSDAPSSPVKASPAAPAPEVGFFGRLFGKSPSPAAPAELV
jgi:hypothetical protein